MAHAKLLHALLGAGCCAALPAQFVNRATWLGVEAETTRRDFRQGTEYYLDRASYVALPPWWDRGLPRFHDQAWYRFGSVSRSEFTIDGGLDVTRPLGGGCGFGWHVLHGENRDVRFLRNAVEFERALGDAAALFVQGELDADKSLIDASLGAWLHRAGDDALRVMVTAVDLSSAKSRRVAYQHEPWAVMAAGAFGERERHRVAFELGAQLPFEVRDLEQSEVFALQRWIGAIESHLHLGGDDRLAAALEVEGTDKSARPDAGPGVPGEQFARDFRQLRLEWWRDARGGPWSIGCLHTALAEDGVVAADPAASLRARRDEWFGVVRLQVPFAGRLSFEPQVFAGHVREAYRDGIDRRSVDRFEGKFACNARWDFSPAAWLAVVVTFELDEPAFGGGGLQFVARF